MRCLKISASLVVYTILTIEDVISIVIKDEVDDLFNARSTLYWNFANQDNMQPFFILYLSNTLEIFQTFGEHSLRRRFPLALHTLLELLVWR